MGSGDDTFPQRLGHFEIIGELGRGGMGVVYQARDTKLHRQVAIKVLPAHLANDADALGRFQREARAVAALSHPNILAVYDVGTDQGISYVVMELLEGETLRQRLRRSAIPWRKAVEYGVAIADGLAAAHARGIIHRDLKPENIFLTSDGVVKILDFGLARVESAEGGMATEDQAATPTMTLDTRPGTVLGTVNYMSPEQISGRATDARTDMFSFGCVLYEMVTGSRAFTGASVAETTTAILRDEPASFADSGQVAPSELDREIARCLEKKPELRIQSARDLGFTLRDILSGSSFATTPIGDATPRAVRPAWLLAAAAVVIVGAFIVFRDRWAGPGAGAAPIDSLAILPFAIADSDADTEYLADEIPSSIINNLSRLASLRVVPRESVFHFMKSGGDRYELARELKAAAVLTGRISVRGGTLRISAELVDVANDRQLWGERYSRKLADILSVETDIATQISQELRLRLTGEERARLAKRYTENSEAHLAYLQGRYFWNKETEEGVKKAIEYFQKAIYIDPDYALPYTGMADAYAELAWWSHIPAYEGLAPASEAAKRALEIDDTLAEAHVSMAIVSMCFEWDWDEAGKRLRRALELNPRYGFAHHMYSHLLSLRGHNDRARAAFEDALKIDPLSPHHMTCLADLFLHMGRYDECARWARKALEIAPDAGGGHLYLGWAYVRKGMLEEAIEEFRKDESICESALAHAYGLAGRRAEAERILNKWLEDSKESFVASVEIAVIYAGLGETDQALDWLERAYEKRDSGWLSFIQVEPPFVSLRGHPRFDELLLRMGLPPQPKAQATAVPPAARIMLAVMPFEDMSPDPQEWFADGMTEEMITGLGRLRPKELGVIARTSAMRYKRTTKQVAEIGRELNVDFVIEGSVRRAGERVRISATLIQVSDQTQLWTQHYDDRSVEDLFDIQAEVAERIAHSLALELLPNEQTRPAGSRTTNREAHEAYLLGRYHWNKRTQAGFEKALDYFQESLKEDSQYAPAYAGLAETYAMLASYNYRPPKEVYPKAELAALKALRIDDTLTEAHVALAKIKWEYYWDWSGAEREFERAIELDPGNATAHQWYALDLSVTGRHEAALAEIELARRIDPLSLIINKNIGDVYFFARQYDRAIEQYQRTAELDSAFTAVHYMLAWAYEQKGMYDEATRAAAQARGWPEAKTDALRSAIAAGGPDGYWRWWLTYFKEESTRTYVSPMDFAQAYALLGESERAFEWLGKALDARDSDLIDLKMDPSFDSLRDDPRFVELLRRVGLDSHPKP